MIELTSSDALLNSFPFVWCDSWRDSRQNFGGSCQFEKNMTFKLYQYVCWCIRQRKRFILMENHSKKRKSNSLGGNMHGNLHLFVFNWLNTLRRRRPGGSWSQLKGIQMLASPSLLGACSHYLFQLLPCFFFLHMQPNQV